MISTPAKRRFHCRQGKMPMNLPVHGRVAKRLKRKIIRRAQRRLPAGSIQEKRVILLTRFITRNIFLEKPLTHKLSASVLNLRNRKKAKRIRPGIGEAAAERKMVIVFAAYLENAAIRAAVHVPAVMSLMKKICPMI